MSHPFLSHLQERARACQRRIALPEATEPRTLKAAALMEEQGVARPVLVGEPDLVVAAAKQVGVNVSGLDIRSPADEATVEVLAERFYQEARAKGLTVDEARQTLRDPLYFSALLVLTGEAAGYVAGATHTTAETVRPALRVFGTGPGVSRISS
ncbi:MAG: phosphate acyltransferase, partial [Acidobacteriota bacterium]